VVQRQVLYPYLCEQHGGWATVSGGHCVVLPCAVMCHAVRVTGIALSCAQGGRHFPA
jgi:hypothetical protein